MRHKYCSSSVFHSGWTATGSRNRNINFDIESTPLQVQTDSAPGSGDLIWVRFIESGWHPGVKIFLNNMPKYSIGFCPEVGDIQFSLPGTKKYRIWTFKKLNNRLKLLCNGVEIYNFNFANSDTSDCRNQWSRNFNKISFPSNEENVDTASDFFRRFTDGM